MSTRKPLSLRSCVPVVAFILSAFSASPVLGQATLENPAPNSFQSGIGSISGWACDATRIEIAFDDGPPVEAAYGTDRRDTQGVCGDANNGFGLLFNWSLLGDGSHTVRALADGMEFAKAAVIVTTLGPDYVTDDLGAFRLPEIPAVETDVVLRWQQSQQKFVIADGSPAPSGGTSGAPPRVLENPAPGSSQSGIGSISGWVCAASRIEIQFNNLPPVEAAYGTSRTDTQSICGDANNGFGLLFNWNLLGDGTHTVRALADGVEFANVTVNVTTFGVAYLTDDLGGFRLQLDPLADMDLVVKYEKTQQSFVPWGCTTQDDPTSHTQCDTKRLMGGERVHDVDFTGLKVLLHKPKGIWMSWEDARIVNSEHDRWAMLIEEPSDAFGFSTQIPNHYSDLGLGIMQGGALSHDAFRGAGVIAHDYFYPGGEEGQTRCIAAVSYSSSEVNPYSPSPFPPRIEGRPAGESFSDGETGDFIDSLRRKVDPLWCGTVPSFLTSETGWGVWSGEVSGSTLEYEPGCFPSDTTHRLFPVLYETEHECHIALGIARYLCVAGRFSISSDVVREEFHVSSCLYNLAGAVFLFSLPDGYQADTSAPDVHFPPPQSFPRFVPPGAQVAYDSPKSTGGAVLSGGKLGRARLAPPRCGGPGLKHAWCPKPE